MSHGLANILPRNRPTAGRKDNIRPLHQFKDLLGFALTKSRLTFNIKNGTDTDAGSLLNLLIGIDKLHPETFGQGTAHRGLAHPHGANEIDITCRDHGSGLIAS